MATRSTTGTGKTGVIDKTLQRHGSDSSPPGKNLREQFAPMQEEHVPDERMARQHHAEAQPPACWASAWRRIECKVDKSIEQQESNEAENQQGIEERIENLEVGKVGGGKALERSPVAGERRTETALAFHNVMRLLGLGFDSERSSSNYNGATEIMKYDGRAEKWRKRAGGSVEAWAIEAPL